jgi:hypothetical protein
MLIDLQQAHRVASPQSKQRFKKIIEKRLID